MYIINKSLLYLSIIFSSYLNAQTEISSGGMLFRYEIIEDSIYCFLSTPEKGWGLIGFNRTNTLNGADLKFFSVQNSQPLFGDFKNKSGRDYNDKEPQNGRIIKGLENEAGCQFVFVLPLNSNDPNDFQFNHKEEFFLILAYSTSDDYQHHSAYRKQFKYRWKYN